MNIIMSSYAYSTTDNKGHDYVYTPLDLFINQCASYNLLQSQQFAMSEVSHQGQHIVMYDAQLCVSSLSSELYNNCFLTNNNDSISTGIVLFLHVWQRA